MELLTLLVRSPDGSASTTNDQTFMPKYIVTADANGVLGRSSGADPDFFYMPAVRLPLKSGDEQSNTGYSRYAGGGQFEVDLRTIFNPSVWAENRYPYASCC